MASNPKPARETPEFGRPTPRTVPLLQERPPLSEATAIVMRDACWRCHGRGELPGPFTTCEVCGREWTFQQIEEQGRKVMRGIMLPCFHVTRGRNINYLLPRCPTCGGAGFLERTVTLGELLDFIESLYPESISREITAHRRAL